MATQQPLYARNLSAQTTLVAGSTGGLAGLSMDFQSILDTGASLLPDEWQKAGQDVVDDLARPVKEVIASVGGESVAGTIVQQAQQGIDMLRQEGGLPPTNPESGAATTSQGTGAPPPKAAAAMSTIIARTVTPWGIGGGVVGGGITFAAMSRMRSRPSMTKRLLAATAAGLATGVIAGMVASR